MARQRDFRAEYRRRLELGRQRGYSRQIARGRHPGEGGRLPDGSRATVVSVQELRGGRLRASTLETMHRINVGLSSDNPEPWVRACLSRGWAVYPNKRKPGYHTYDDISREVIDSLTSREIHYFFGY